MCTRLHTRRVPGITGCAKRGRFRRVSGRSQQIVELGRGWVEVALAARAASIRLRGSAEDTCTAYGSARVRGMDAQGSESAHLRIPCPTATCARAPAEDPCARAQGASASSRAWRALPTQETTWDFERKTRELRPSNRVPPSESASTTRVCSHAYQTAFRRTQWRAGPALVF